MRRWWHFAIPPAALLFQAAPPLFIRFMSQAAYGRAPWLSEPQAYALSLWGLAACAAACLLLGCGGTYLLLRRSRKRVAVPLIGVACFPSTVAGVVYLHALLVFLTLV